MVLVPEIYGNENARAMQFAYLFPTLRVAMDADRHEKVPSLNRLMLGRKEVPVLPAKGWTNGIPPKNDNARLNRAGRYLSGLFFDRC